MYMVAFTDTVASCILNCNNILFGFHIWSIIQQILESQESKKRSQESFTCWLDLVSQKELHFCISCSPMQKLRHTCRVCLTSLAPIMRGILYTPIKDKVTLMLNLRNFLSVACVLTPLSACSFHCKYLSLKFCFCTLFKIFTNHEKKQKKSKFCSAPFIHHLSLLLEKKPKTTNILLLNYNMVWALSHFIWHVS